MADCMRTKLAALRSLQRSISRKNGSIKLIVTRSVDRIICGTNKQSRSELKHGQTDRQTYRPNFRNPRCACAPSVNSSQWHRIRVFLNGDDEFLATCMDIRTKR